MAAPSRIYVGVVVFGLIASLVTVTYTLLFLSGYRPPPEPPLVYLDPPQEPAKQLFLILASIFSVAFTWVSWRQLIGGARQDRATRERRAALAKEQVAYKREMLAVKRIEQEKKRPPGYT